MEESKCISRAPGYFHWVLVTFKICLTCRISPPEVFSRRGCSANVLGIFGGVSVHGCDFNKVAKGLC